MSSPIPFEEVPPGTLFYHVQADGSFGTMLKLNPADSDVRAGSNNTAIVKRNPSPGFCGNGWLTMFNPSTLVFLEKPEQWEEITFGEAPEGSFLKFATSKTQVLKLSSTVVGRVAGSSVALTGVVIGGDNHGLLQIIPPDMDMLILKNNAEEQEEV